MKEKNELIRQEEWMKNPFFFSQIGGSNLSLMERNIMVYIARGLNEKIKEYYDNRSAERGQTNIFSDDEIRQGGGITLELYAEDMDIQPRMYEFLDEACKNLAKTSFSFIGVDDETGKTMRYHMPIFSYIAMEEFGEKVYGKVEEKDVDGETVKVDKTHLRRRGYIKVSFNEQMTKRLFNMRSGYTTHITKIVTRCKVSRTPALYVYLAKYRSFLHKEIPLAELKEYLGTVDVDDKGNIVKDSYPKFSKFKVRILDAIANELKELAEKNLVDFYITYEPKYKRCVQRGNPDSIKFTMILSDLGKMHKDGDMMQSFNESVKEERNNVASRGLTESEWNKWQKIVTGFEGNKSIQEVLEGIDINRVGDKIELLVPTKAFLTVPSFKQPLIVISAAFKKVFGYEPNYKAKG